MAADFPVSIGDTAETAQLSPCVGGLVRTWTNGSSHLWSTPDADWLLGVQGTGMIARTLREDRRFREAALLVEDTGTLLVHPRVPVTTESDTVQMQANAVRLEPAGDPRKTVFDDFRALLTRAIGHCIGNDEFLVVEQGGWDAPTEPFCLHIVVAEDDRAVSVIETAPAPRGSEYWEPHIVEGRDPNSLSAPATAETLEVAPILMMEAISRWGLQPWDLALTFGLR